MSEEFKEGIVIDTNDCTTDPIHSDRWTEMSVPELNKQMDILIDRQNASISIGSAELYRAVTLAIEQLKLIIESKQGDDYLSIF